MAFFEHAGEARERRLRAVEGHVVAVEHDPARAHDRGEPAVHDGELRRRQPVQRGRREDDVEPLLLQRCAPVRVTQVTLYPAQTPVDGSERLPSDREQDRIEVERHAARRGEALEQPLADRARTACEVKRKKLLPHELLDGIEHHAEARLARRQIAFLLTIPA